MRQINEIIIHCSATRPDWMADAGGQAKVDEIRRWHVEGNGWSDIGYHDLIDRDGKRYKGRPHSKAGAHCKGHNSNSLGVCLIGGHGSSENDLPEDHFTPEHMAALRLYVDEMKVRYTGIKSVTGHNTRAAKACPGFNVERWLSQRKPRTSPTQSSTLQATAAAGASTVAAAGTAMSQLDGNAQLLVIGLTFVTLAALAWIFRERLQKWGKGDR